LEVNDQNTNSETSYHLRPLIATDYTKLVWKTGYMSVQDIHNRIKKFKQKKYFVANAWTMQKIWMRNEKIMWELKR
jgi:maltoporin